MNKKEMNFKEFMYFGRISKEDFKLIYPRVLDKNYGNVMRYSVIAGILAVCLLIGSFFAETLSYSRVADIAFMIGMIIIYLLCMTLVKNNRKMIMPVCDLFCVMVYIFAIFIGIQRPDVPATTFFVLSMALPLAFTNFPIKIVVQVIISSIIFSIFSILFKNKDIAIEDVTNAIVFGMVTIIVNIYMASVKIRDLLGTYKLEKGNKELAEKDIMLNNLVSNIPGGMVIYKLSENIEALYTTEGVPQLTGRTMEEYNRDMKGNPIENLLYEEDVPVLIKEIQKNVPAGTSVNGTYRVKHKDGHLVWVVLSAVKIGEDDGCPIYYAVYSQVPERVGNYATICEEAPIPVYIIDKKNYEILYCNQACINITGHSIVGEGRRCYEYILHRNSPCKTCQMECVKGNETIESSIVTPFDRCVYTVHGKSIDWNGTDAYLVYLSDDTFRIKVMEEKEKLKKAREENAAKNNFLARMSHDLRTPLNAIIGFSSEEMLHNTTESEKKDYFEKIQDSSKYLLGMINDILEMSKIESGNMKFVMSQNSFEETFASISNIVMPLAKGKNISIKINYKNISKKEFYTDKVRLEQIFVNILSNAIKFTKVNGVILTMIEQYKKDEKWYYKVSVRDFGIGISKEFLPHIFEEFAQENYKDNEKMGTGLGLSIVKKLVDVMKGNIYVDSRLGKGSVFVVELPLVWEQKETLEKTKKEVEITDDVFKNKKILVFEDHPLNAEITRKLLEKKGCSVTVATNGKIGLDIFEQSVINEYDAIMMDIRMPIMDGIEVTKVIRELEREDAKKIPIIAMTANAFDEDIEASLAIGMNEHLAKPVKPNELFGVLGKYLCER